NDARTQRFWQRTGEGLAVPLPRQAFPRPAAPLAADDQSPTSDVKEQGARAPHKGHITTFWWDCKAFLCLAAAFLLDCLLRQSGGLTISARLSPAEWGMLNGRLKSYYNTIN